jgi:hypothetical protein
MFPDPHQSMRAERADFSWQAATANWLTATAAEFELPHVAFTPATEFLQYVRFKAWLAADYADYAGELVYLWSDEGTSEVRPCSLSSSPPEAQ